MSVDLALADLPDMLESRQVAEVFHMVPQTVRKMCQQRRLPGAVKVSRRWLVPRATVVAVMRGQPTPAVQRRELLGDETVEFLEELAANAPPLTQAQRDTIRAAFQGAGET